MTTPLSSSARRWFMLSAILAWLGLAVSITLNITNAYPSTTTVASRYGFDRSQGVSGRLADWISYFTIWSNILVAIVTSIFASGRPVATALLRALRLDAVLLITITGLVYAVVLAPTSVQRGWDNLSNSLLHQVTPALTVVLWLVFGPRGWVSGKTVLGSLVVPLAWLAWMLGRGAVVGAYPYPFVDVVALGYPTVLVNVVGILGMGLVLALLYWGLDRWLTRRGAHRGSGTARS